MTGPVPDPGGPRAPRPLGGYDPPPPGSYRATPPGGYGTPPAGGYGAPPPVGGDPGYGPAPRQYPEQDRYAPQGPPDVSEVSVGDLIGNVTRDLSTLMRQELALAQAELKQEATTTGKAASALGAAGLAGWLVILFLSLALWAGLSHLMDPGWAALLVAVLWAAVAAGLFVTGRANLRKVHPKPERTVDTLSQVPEALKGQRGAVR